MHRHGKRRSQDSTSVARIYNYRIALKLNPIVWYWRKVQFRVNGGTATIVDEYAGVSKCVLAFRLVSDSSIIFLESLTILAVDQMRLDS